MSLKWNKILMKTGIAIFAIGIGIILIWIPVMVKDKILADNPKIKIFTWSTTHLVIKNADINETRKV